MKAISDCTSTPPGELLQALGEFNRGDWFECHETLEELWVGSEGEMRNFYQGLLQVAAALHHWRNGNFGGAIHLLTGGADYLRRVRPVCRRIDVGAVVTATDLFRESLVVLGAEQMEEVDRSLIPRLQLVSTGGFKQDTPIE